MRSRLASMLRFLFKRQELERELDAELRFHLDRLIEQNIARGMSAADARRQAALIVGGVEATKEACRDARAGRLMESLLQDIRYGVRVLRKNPGFACTAIATLALGVGANTAIFSLVYGVLLRPLPYAHGGQLVVLHQNVPQAHVFDFPFSVKELVDYREGAQTLLSIVEHHTMNFVLMDRDQAQRVDAAVVSANFFDVLGVKPLVGRTFVAADDAPNADAVVILSHSYWQSHHGGDRGAVGRIVLMNGRPHTVIGVLPPIPQYPGATDIYVPTSLCPTRSNPRFIENRNARMMTAFGRLKEGVTVEQAQADLSVVANNIASAHPETYLRQDGYTLVASPLQDDLTRRARTMFLVLLGVAGFVLLIACANVANLLLARLLKLERELVVRAALGASRMRLLRQVLTESVVLSACGGAVGLALAPAALRLLVQFAQRFTARAAEVRVDAPVLAFAMLVSVGTGVLLGLAPALFSSGWIGSAFQQSAQWSTVSRSRHRLRGALVVIQVAVSVVLLAGAGLMIRTFARLQQVDPGFATDHLLTMRLSPLSPPYDMQRIRELADRIIVKVRALPGADSASLASSFPFNPTGVVTGPGRISFEIDSQPPARGDVTPTTDVRIVGARYFETIRQPILRGRAFEERDERADPGVLVINQSMARHRFPHEDPLGKRIRFNLGTLGWTPWQEIVGVADDVREYGPGQPAVDEVYGVYNRGFVNRLIVRTAQDPASMEPTVRAALRDIDPRIAIDNVYTVERAQYESMTSPRVMMLLLGMFAGLAALISASGIAAVMALAVSQRTREIGVRMALGARVGSIIGMVMRQGLFLALAGIVFGMTGAAALTRLLSAFLYGTSPTDVVTFLAAPLLFLAVSAAACFVSARQVTFIDPLVALRQE
jgi:putative ABC transport system permease protein